MSFSNTGGKTSSIKKAIMLRFGIILGLFAFFLVLIVSCIFLVVQAKEVVAQNNLHKEYLYQYQIAKYSWGEEIMEHVGTGHAFDGELDADQCTVGRMKTAVQSFTDPYLANFLSENDAIHQEMHQYAQELIALPDDAFDEKLDMYINKVEPLIVEVTSIIDGEIDILSVQSSEAEASLDVLVYTYLVLAVLVLVILVVVLLTTLAYINKNVIAPINMLSAESRKLADGKLDLNFDTNCRVKEVNELADALMFSTSQLKNMLESISECMSHLSNKNFTVYPNGDFKGDFEALSTSVNKLIDNLRGVMSNVKSSATEVAHGSEQVQSTSLAFVQGALEQSESIVRLSSAIENISEKVSENAKNARNANELSKDVETVVDKSTSEMKQLMLAINEIAQTSSDIEKIIKTIENIAFQTNLLALNAAVEAARAGQAGKGFAVVADEVRSLASRSAEAAQNTTMLIEASLNAVTRGTNLANSTNEAFTEVSEKSRSVIDLVAKISVASEEQSANIEEISQSVTEISGVVQTNTATSEESAASSEDLSRQAKKMNDVIAQFRV